jgi:hypothetical protein
VIRLRRCGGAEDFLELAGPFLLEREAEHNLMLGIAGRLSRNPTAEVAYPYFAVVERDGAVSAAALRTPPWNLILSATDELEAVDALVEDVADEELPGVLGPSAETQRFAEAWRSRTGATTSIAIRERIHEADTVITPPAAPGSMRPYSPADRELALAWTREFTAEALPESPPEDEETLLDRRLALRDARLVFWDDGEPVSFAGFGGATPNGIRIGPVYTPPHLRRHGYATSLVAALTASLLEGGRRFCFLYTDLANPTSNAIYARVGYRPVADADQWRFGQ